MRTSIGTIKFQPSTNRPWLHGPPNFKHYRWSKYQDATSHYELAKLTAPSYICLRTHQVPATEPAATYACKASTDKCTRRLWWENHEFCHWKLRLYQDWNWPQPWQPARYIDWSSEKFSISSTGHTFGQILWSFSHIFATRLNDLKHMLRTAWQLFMKHQRPINGDTFPQLPTLPT